MKAQGGRNQKFTKPREKNVRYFQFNREKNYANFTLTIAWMK